MPPKTSKQAAHTRNSENWVKAQKYILQPNKLAFFRQNETLLDINVTHLRSKWDENDLLNHIPDTGKGDGLTEYNKLLDEVICEAAERVLETEIKAHPNLPKPQDVLQATGWMDLSGNLTVGKEEYPSGWSEDKLRTEMYLVYGRLGKMILTDQRRFAKRGAPAQSEEESELRALRAKVARQETLQAVNSKDVLPPQSSSSKRNRANSSGSVGASGLSKLAVTINEGKDTSAIVSEEASLPAHARGLQHCLPWMRIAVRNENKGKDAIEHFPVGMIVADDHVADTQWALQHLDIQKFLRQMKALGFLPESDTIFYYSGDNDTEITGIDNQHSFQNAIRQQLRNYTDMYIRFYFVVTTRLSHCLAPLATNEVGEYDPALASDSSEDVAMGGT